MSSSTHEPKSPNKQSNTSTSGGSSGSSSSSSLPLPIQILFDFIRSPIFAGAVATSISSLPSIPYNNILFTSGSASSSTNPTFKEVLTSAKTIIAREGFWNFRNKEGRGLMRCMSPAFCGQLFYGAALFYFFAAFRARFLNDEFNKEVGRKRNTLSEIAISSFGAEFWAAFFLAPFEVAYLRMMLNRSEFPQTLGLAFKELSSNSSKYGFPFAPLRTLWGSGMPRTAATFTMFEIFSVLFSSSYVQQAQAMQASKMSGGGANGFLQEPSRSAQLQVSFSAGFFAGMCYEFIFHPYDHFCTFRQQVRDQFGNPNNHNNTTEQMKMFKENPFSGNKSLPTSGQILSQWFKTQTDPRTLWRGFGPRAWIGSFGCGLMWMTYDLITGKNRIVMPHHHQQQQHRS